MLCVRTLALAPCTLSSVNALLEVMSSRWLYDVESWMQTGLLFLAPFDPLGLSNDYLRQSEVRPPSPPANYALIAMHLDDGCCRAFPALTCNDGSSCRMLPFSVAHCWIGINHPPPPSQRRGESFLTPNSLPPHHIHPLHAHTHTHTHACTHVHTHRAILSVAHKPTTCSAQCITGA